MRRTITRKNRTPWIVMLIVGSLLVVLSAPEILAELASSASYRLERQAVTTAGSVASTSYKMLVVAGEPSDLLEATSTSYRFRPGYGLAPAASSQSFLLWTK